MAQHDFEIDNQTAPQFRTDLNNALEALATLSSGATAPTTTYPNMLWYDTANTQLKMRTEADDAWITIGTLNQGTNTFEVANLTELTQGQAEDDTDTTFGTVSGERLAQAANEAIRDVHGKYEWGTYTRSAGTSYENTTDYIIHVSITGLSEGARSEISSDGVSWVTISDSEGDDRASHYFAVPPGWYYRFESGENFTAWREMRYTP